MDKIELTETARSDKKAQTALSVLGAEYGSKRTKPWNRAGMGPCHCVTTPARLQIFRDQVREEAENSSPKARIDEHFSREAPSVVLVRFIRCC